MNVLGLDTATFTAGLAIVSSDDDRVLAEARHDTSGRTADLLVGIDAVCRAAGLAPRELDAIAIGAGPGSFTGLRIGMATAKGIAFAARRPLWAVSSLAALAEDAFRAAADRDGALPHGVVVAVLDARKGEVFAGCFRYTSSVAGRATVVAVAPEQVLAPADLAAWAFEIAGHAPGDANAPTRFAGDALAVHHAILGPLADSWMTAIATPSGAAVARVALAGERVDVLVGGAPTYIRLAEAEVMYPDGIPGALPKTRH